MSKNILCTEDYQLLPEAKEMIVSPEMWTLDDSLEVEAVCPICLDFYFNPVYLSCAHIFCFDCIKNWMAKGEYLVLICPLCRKENKRPVMHEKIIRELAILIKQHGPLLKRYMGLMAGPVGLSSEDKVLEAKTCDSSLAPTNDFSETGDSSLAPTNDFSETGDSSLAPSNDFVETGDSSLVPSNGLRHDCCGEPGPNLVKNPQRSNPLAGVSDSFNISLVCQEGDGEKRKEWVPGVFKEQLNRTNLAITRWKIPGDAPSCSLSQTAPSPGSASKLMWQKKRVGSSCSEEASQQKKPSS